MRAPLLFAGMALLIVLVGVFQSWNSALLIVIYGLISGVMALGVNLQWGYAGLFNVGIMGFVALGALGSVLVSMPPVPEAWAAGGARVLAALAVGAAAIVAAVLAWQRLRSGWLVAVILIGGLALFRFLFDPAVAAIEAVNPAGTGFLGGLNPCGADYRACGWMALIAWPAGGLLAAGAAWIVGKTALGLRSDYLAIATLGIAEIVLAVIKNEDWLDRGVKNVVGLPRPVPYEVDLQADPGFVARAQGWGVDPVATSSILVKLAWIGLFGIVLVLIIALMERALNSPWGRMMRAIRDNEVAAEAMGKDVTRRHLQIFILGSAICGVAGAMMATFEGQLTPGSYQPLRFTFMIWVMVIVGGSGNNWGAVLGGMLIWFFWVQVEELGRYVMAVLTWPLPDGWLKDHLLGSVQHMRLLTMGVILLLVLRFSPRGLLPER
jgi:branched-chain amino acid transport system permease protein